jgi:hypothetical protein
MMTAPYTASHWFVCKTIRALMPLLLLAAASQFHVAAAETTSPPPTAVESASGGPPPANAGFEAGVVGEAPAHWTVPPVPGFQVVVSDDRPAAGDRCATISCITEPGANPFGNLIQRIDAAPFRGQRVRYRAAVRAEVEGRRNQAQLWFRVDRVGSDGARALGAFDNMGDRPITAAGWNHYEIVGDVAEDASRITIGMMFLGKGQAWLDEVSLKVVGKDVPLTAKSPQGAGRSGKAIDEIKPGLFEIVGSMRIASVPGAAGVARDGADKDAVLKSAVLVPLPLAYRDQAPLNYRFAATPPGAVEAIEIYEDSPLNFVLKATIAAGSESEPIDLQFSSTVLVGPSDFAGVPEKALIPDAWPEDAKPWLAATWCADAEHERIRALAEEIRAGTTDVPEIIRRVQQTAGGIFRRSQGQGESLTAVAVLDKRGSCTSCANLVAALLRAAGVPARVLAGYPSWSGPLQTHYIVEAYVPGFGWYPIESTLSQAPWPNTHQVHVAIIPPRHECEAQAGPRLGIAGGVPYLSLTELPDNDRSLFAAGTIEGSPGCDHECRVVRTLEGRESAPWQRAIVARRSAWNAWLQSNPSLDAEGRFEFGDSSEDLAAASVAHLFMEQE